MVAIRIVATKFAFVGEFIPLQCITLDSILPAIYQREQEQMIRTTKNFSCKNIYKYTNRYINIYNYIQNVQIHIFFFLL